eukprot:SAG11_NODE_794_length_7137_cov_45.288576_10_plen_77_part_00
MIPWLLKLVLLFPYPGNGPLPVGDLLDLVPGCTHPTGYVVRLHSTINHTLSVQTYSILVAVEIHRSNKSATGKGPF